MAEAMHLSLYLAAARDFDSIRKRQVSRFHSSHHSRGNHPPTRPSRCYRYPAVVPVSAQRSLMSRGSTSGTPTGAQSVSGPSPSPPPAESLTLTLQAKLSVSLEKWRTLSDASLHIFRFASCKFRRKCTTSVTVTLRIQMSVSKKGRCV